jgi:hypothetical protein
MPEGWALALGAFDGLPVPEGWTLVEGEHYGMPEGWALREDAVHNGAIAMLKP